MPTFRNAQEDAYYRFSDDEIEFLRDWLRRNNAVLGMREHMADSARVYGQQLARLDTLDLSDDAFPNVEVLYRLSSALVTDYSSCFIDYMLTGKPAISFAYDHDSYPGIERGAFYDLDFVFPGPVCRTFAQLRDALDGLFEPLVRDGVGSPGMEASIVLRPRRRPKLRARGRAGQATHGLRWNWKAAHNNGLQA